MSKITPFPLPGYRRARPPPLPLSRPARARYLRGLTPDQLELYRLARKKGFSVRVALAMAKANRSIPTPQRDSGLE
jgi:hypothetical protein